jgi:hypothetical protein
MGECTDEWEEVRVEGRKSALDGAVFIDHIQSECWHVQLCTLFQGLRRLAT